MTATKTRAMTMKTALAHAKKLWGTSAMVNDRGWKNGSTPEERADAMAELRALPDPAKEFRWTWDDVGDDMTMWHVRVVTEHMARYRKDLERKRALIGGRIAHQFAVGKVIQPFGAFMVKGEGDTWEQAFEQAAARHG